MTLLLEPGLVQAFEKVIDPGLALVQFHGGSQRGEFRVEFLQIGQRGSRVLDLAELGEPGNDTGQTGYVTAVDGPRPSPGLDRLGIVPELVVSGCQAGEPDEQTRVTRAEANSLLGARDPLLGPTLELSTAPSTACAAAKLGLSLIASWNLAAARSVRVVHIEIRASAKWAFG